MIGDGPISCARPLLPLRLPTSLGCLISPPLALAWVPFAPDLSSLVSPVALHLIRVRFTSFPSRARRAHTPMAFVVLTAFVLRVNAIRKRALKHLQVSHPPSLLSLHLLGAHAQAPGWTDLTASLGNTCPAARSLEKQQLRTRCQATLGTARAPVAQLATSHRCLAMCE